MSQIPVIDLAPWFNDEPAHKQTITQQVTQACTEIGFFMIRGHGIPIQTIEAANAAARDFFDQPPAAKQKMDAGNGMGYIGPSGENLAASLDDDQMQDQKESLNLVLPITEQIWPIEPPSVRADCQTYYVALLQLSYHLMQIFALALDLPQTWFDDKVNDPRTILRLLNYPPTQADPQHATRAGAHTDYGTLTILWSPDSRGLQAKNRRGEWIDIVAPVDHFIINIGDLMMNWTNDRWLSTLHRVVAHSVVPHRDTAGARRQSMAFFHNPNPDARIQCIPTCLGEGEVPIYEPILAKEHLEMKIAKSLGKEGKL